VCVLVTFTHSAVTEDELQFLRPLKAKYWLMSFLKDFRAARFIQVNECLDSDSNWREANPAGTTLVRSCVILVWSFPPVSSVQC
jgi:hypothetical protein